MDPTRQSRLLEAANKHFENDYASPEAKKGLTLTSGLRTLTLRTGEPGEWFDASVHDHKKIAVRITKTQDSSEFPEMESDTNSLDFDIEVGVTSETGSMDQDDTNLLVINWASISFDLTPSGLRYPCLCVIDADIESHDVPEVEVEPSSVDWDEVQYTVDQAHAADLSRLD